MLVEGYVMTAASSRRVVEAFSDELAGGDEDAAGARSELVEEVVRVAMSTGA